MSRETVQTFRSAIPLFQALSDPARQDIILLLAEKEPMSVNAIAGKSSLSRPAISHHLKVLRDAGLVATEQKGTQRCHSLSLDGALDQLKTLIHTMETTYGQNQ
ncbi:ArsR family transcriptional regulator [Melghirimyces profundicolus]|uniref:ArsR family transcriptional regulator n=1 Tax=Melghirimyces profundicolus TaxID=1242148 RepID=A0A2T6BCF4_9BACL|nr:metalloregulator ArsR/SmtB family transcription factor [Melghirimyces profundicolus]PTX53747.1 ArsR family transcriptional regulator [Melghirimyces profundicolus]